MVLRYLPEALHPAWQVLLDYPVLGALALGLLGWGVASAVTALFRRSFSLLTHRTRTAVDDQLVAVVSRPLFATVLYAFLALAVLAARLGPAVSSALIRVLVSLAIVLWAVAAFRIAAVLLEAISRRQDRLAIVQPRTVPLFDIVSKLLVVAVAAYALLALWDIDATAWLASAGVIGIAVGFAAKDTLANLFSGLFIVADSPYKIGDYVNLDSGERGVVTHVGLRSTRILTRDDIEITVPNAVIANAKIINESGGRWVKSRIRVPVGVAYGSDADEVCRILADVAESHPESCTDPAPRVRLRDFGESSLNFELLCWIDDPVLRGKVGHELRMEIYRRFAAEGVEIPFPQRVIHLPEGGLAS